MNPSPPYARVPSENAEEHESLIPKKSDRFKQPAYKDVWASALFGASFLSFVVISSYAIPAIEFAESGDSRDNAGVEAITKEQLATACILSVFSSFLISFGYFYCIKRFAGKMIYGSFIASIAVQFVVGFVMLSSYFQSQDTGQLIAALALLGFGLLSVYLYNVWKSRIPFARVMLRSVTSVIGKYPATLFAGVIGLVAQSAFGVYWLVTFVGISQWLQEDNNSAFIFLALFSILMFYWTVQVIQNIVHVTVSGLFGTYYFLGENINGKVSINVHNPTAKAAKRAFTTSFGPICYGSLLIALVQLLRFVINYVRQNARENDNAVAVMILCCLECIVSSFEGLLEYFNKYAVLPVFNL